MASKKNEDKKRAGTTAAAPARKAVPAKKMTAAKKVVPVKKAAPAGKVASTTRRKGVRPAVGGTQDRCEQLSREINKLRKELRDGLKALGPAPVQRSAVVDLTLAGTVPDSDELLGVEVTRIESDSVTFKLSGGDTATLSQVASGQGRIVLELRPGGTNLQHLSLHVDLEAALMQLFYFLTQNTAYVGSIGVAVTCPTKCP